MGTVDQRECSKDHESKSVTKSCHDCLQIANFLQICKVSRKHFEKIWVNEGQFVDFLMNSHAELNWIEYIDQASDACLIDENLLELWLLTVYAEYSVNWFYLWSKINLNSSFE